MSEDPKNPFEPEPDFFSNPESFANESKIGEPLADFFDDVDSFTEPGPLEPFPPVVEDSVLSHTHEHVESVEPLAPRPVPQPASSRTATKPKPATDGNPKVLPASISMLLLGGALVGGGIGLGKFLPSTTETAPATAAATPTPATPDAAAAPAPAPTATAPEPASAEELKTLAAKVEAISKSVEEATKSFTGLQTKVAALPKPAPPADLTPIETKITAIETKLGDLAAKPATPAPGAMPDLKPIEAKVDGLAKTVTAIPSQVDALKAKIEAQEKTIAALKAELSQKPATATAATAGSTPTMPATPSPTTPAVDAEASIEAAVALYRQDQFGPARDAFVKLQSVAPNDARVWYYSALSNGFATNQWAEGSDTTRYATRGVEREKAGTPDRAKIDSAFTQLRPDAKGWLDAYRAQAR